MNKQELIEEIKQSNEVFLKMLVLYLIEQLDEPQPLKLKDIISRMKQLFPLSRSEWIDEIKKEFGEEFCLWKYKAGYEQGKLEGIVEREKVTIPQFVADWIANVKRNGFKFRNSSRFYEEIVSSDDVYRVMYYILKESIAGEAIRIWVNANRDAFARAWLDGYEVEKEKRYLVKVKGVNDYGCYLNKGLLSKEYFLESKAEIGGCRTKHTRKELEEDGFGWVFDCPWIEIEEVED